MSLTPGAQLGPYRIVSQLGAGGMGVVYQPAIPGWTATSPSSSYPDLTRDETAKQRFLQEAKSASALDHPNICTIYEINETDDGQLYLVMAHYEGETLKERIARGPLELSDAIDIATQVGEGLAKAHAAGIVHRDIKPANLMVTTEGTVKILDFGLAKLAGSEGVTQTGTTVGTVAYMSPEQARGQEVDHRTDIWSLGVVLYEMLAGTPPFQGETLAAVVHATLEHRQPPLSGASSPAQGAVTLALSKDKTQRYQAVADLLTELRVLQSGSDAATVATPAKADVPSIAVLPFADMSPQKDQDYFCEGMAEELIDALARLDGLRVVSRTSSFQFRGKGHDLREVGRKLRVKSVLEGSVRKAGDRLRINAQLINTDDDSHLWSERYDRDMHDVFAVQDEIARAVVTKLKVKLLGEQASVRAPNRAAGNLEAYNLVLKGRYHDARIAAPELDKALKCFAEALALEPEYAEAHAGIAIAHGRGAIVSYAPPHDLMPLAKKAAQRALGLDESVASAHAALGMVFHWYEWDWLSAEREYRRALDLNPADTFARGLYAMLLAQEGRADDSVAQARDAVDRDPLDVHSRHMLALMLQLARRYESMMAEAEAGLDLDRTFHILYWDLGWALVGLERNEEAVTAFRQATTLAPGDVFSLSYLGSALGLAGHKEEALRILEALQARRDTQYVGGLFLAFVYSGLGDHDQAISWLEKAAEERDGWMVILKTWPAFDPLRSDPRFQALLQRMNFPANDSAANQTHSD